MSALLAYFVALFVCHIAYLFAQIPFGILAFGILAPIARRSPGAASYIGTLMGFGAAYVSVPALLLFSLPFTKTCLIAPALVRLLSDLSRWSRSSAAFAEADPATQK